MRKAILFNNLGVSFGIDFIGPISPSNKNFINEFFKRSGCLKHAKLLDVLNYVYSDDEDVLERLKNVNDSYSIHIIYNDVEKTGNDWDINLFLSQFFATDVYADIPCIFVAEDEMNRDCDPDVTDEVLNDFRQTFDAIYDAVTYQETDVENYLSKLKIAIDNNKIIELDDFTEVKDFQDEYIGTKKLNNFSKIEETNGGSTILKRSGIMVFTNQNDNSGMYFFSQYYPKILNDSEYKEIVS